MPPFLPSSLYIFMHSNVYMRRKPLSRYHLKLTITKFYRWLDTNSIILADVTPDHINAFAKQPGKSPTSLQTAGYNTRQINIYLRWLHERGEFHFSPPKCNSVKLPLIAIKFISGNQATPIHGTVRRFHRWCDAQSLSLQQLTTEHIAAFLRPDEKRKAVQPIRLEKPLATYLQWLGEQGALTFDPMALFSNKVQRSLPLSLPPSAENFLKNHRHLKPVVRSFYRWVYSRKVMVSGVRPEEVHAFLDDFRKATSPRMGSILKRGLFTYLCWLHQRNEISFDPRCLGIRQRTPLPPSASQFLRTLEPTHRPSTCSQYKSGLADFHDWLSNANLSLQNLNRTHLEQWLLSLSDRRLQPATRRTVILQVRAYCRWLFEFGELKHEPDFLFRRGDLPKLPFYLPRPLQPDVDAELQRRLLEANDVLSRALWLARQTGMRIGELIDLSFDCIRTDAAGRRFLMVPLGKLNTERLVPLTEKACEVISTMQCCHNETSTLLINRHQSRHNLATQLREALAKASVGLQDPNPITPHRLRHTCATTLLSGGMSLSGVMKFLGHRDYRMTLRYAAITQDAVSQEYYAALQRLEQKYDLRLNPPTVASASHFDPIKSLTDVIAWLNRSQNDSALDTTIARTLTKRIMRMQTQMAVLITPGPL